MDNPQQLDPRYIKTLADFKPSEQPDMQFCITVSEIQGGAGVDINFKGTRYKYLGKGRLYLVDPPPKPTATPLPSTTQMVPNPEVIQFSAPKRPQPPAINPALTKASKQKSIGLTMKIS